MKTVKVEVLDKAAYLIPIGDLHIGDKGFDKEAEKKVRGYVRWVKEKPNAYVFLMGDIINCATLGSKTTPFEQILGYDDQISKLISIFEPIKEKIIGSITGNHEYRLIQHCGGNPTKDYSDRLGVPCLGYCGTINFKIGQKTRGSKQSTRMQYSIFAHHTKGGGSTPGSKLNTVDKLRKLVTNADVYLGAHNHGLSASRQRVSEHDKNNNTYIKRRQVLVTCGGFLNYEDSYAEQMGLEQADIGSPRIRLDGLKKDVHCEV